ncbi:SR-related and CTD-associated factor 4-like [Ptychodera flava]|uniref:SR-related and CTD-associated factor 4-like n=1 Tax=Ptychodera flava TaxID=63121 RepID=UPI00396A5CBB
MDAVRTFNNELSSIYECKPPISRAKMTSVTKAAIKAIKFYKHVVQSVEKFIQKCRPEYKIPGLYVIDSIVRQSRHQFGADKDVFAPRFAKNVNNTFQHLFKCPPDDKAKVVRVLNLWQKNGVFGADIIQPLLDMANPELAGQNAEAAAKTEPPVVKQEPPAVAEAVTTKDPEDVQEQTAPPTMASLQHLIQQTQEAQHQQQQTLQQLQVLQQQIQKQAQPSPKPPQLDNSFMAQIQALSASLAVATAAAVNKPGATAPQPSEEKSSNSGFNKALLDFDYGDEDEDTQDKTIEKKTSPAPETLPTAGGTSSGAVPSFPNVELIQQLTESLKHGEAQSGLQEQLKQRLQQQQQQQQQQQSQQLQHQEQYQQMDQQFHQQSLPPQDMGQPHQFSEPMELEESSQPTASEEDTVVWKRESDEDRQEEKRRRSRSPKRHRSRSRSRSRSPRRRRRRSRSRSRSRSRRKRTRSRSRSRSPRHKERRKEREREKERLKKGLPPIKSKHLTVCSTTVWLGHLTKSTSEKEIKDTFEEYGPIQSIDMIPPRGCAFVCMVHRQDAYRALQKLKNLKIHGNTIKMTWATNKGIKGNTYKKYWEVDLGVTYIPWEKLPKDTDLDSLSEGGMIDKETLPPELQKGEEGENSQQSEEKKDLAKMSQDDLIAMAAAQAAADTGATSQQGTPMTDQGTPSQTPGSTPIHTPSHTPQTIAGMPSTLPAAGVMVRPPGYPPTMPFPPFPGFNPTVPPPPYSIPGYPRPPMGVPPPGMLGQMTPAPVPPVRQPAPQAQPVNPIKTGSEPDNHTPEPKLGFHNQGDKSSSDLQDSKLHQSRFSQLHATQQQIASHMGVNKPGVGEQPPSINQPKETLGSDFPGPQGQNGTVTSLAGPMPGQRMPFMQGVMNQLGVRMAIGMAAMRQNQMNQGVGTMGVPPTSQMASTVSSTQSTAQEMSTMSQQGGPRMPLLPAPGQGGLLNRPGLATSIGGQIPNLMSINIRGQSQLNPQALNRLTSILHGPPGAMRPTLMTPGIPPRLPGMAPTSMGQGDQQTRGTTPGVQQGPIQYPLPGLRVAANISGIAGAGFGSGQAKPQGAGPGMSQVPNAHFGNRDQFSAARDVDERRLPASEDRDFQANDFQDRFKRSEVVNRGFSQDRDRWGQQSDDRGPNRGMFNEKWNAPDREKDRDRGFDAPSFDRGIRDNQGQGMPERRDWRDRGFERPDRDWRDNRSHDRRDRDWPDRERGRDRDRDRESNRDRDREGNRDRDRDRSRDYDRGWDRDNRRRDWLKEDRDRRGGDRESRDQRDWRDSDRHRNRSEMERHRPDTERNRSETDSTENDRPRSRFSADNQSDDNKNMEQGPAQGQPDSQKDIVADNVEMKEAQPHENVKESENPDKHNESEDKMAKQEPETAPDIALTQKEENVPVQEIKDDAQDISQDAPTIAPPSDKEEIQLVVNHTSTIQPDIEFNNSQGNENACDETPVEHKTDGKVQPLHSDSTDVNADDETTKTVEKADEAEIPSEQASA